MQKKKRAKGPRFSAGPGRVYQMLQLRHLLAVVEPALLFTSFFIWSITVFAVLQCSTL